MTPTLISVTLSPPPSANALTRSVNLGWAGTRTVATREAKEWRRVAVGRAVVAARRVGSTPIPPKTPWRVTIHAAIDRRRDLDNVIKPILDALTTSGIVPDDRWCDKIEAFRVPVDGDPVVTVSVRRA